MTPKFKANVTARYEFPLGSFDAHLQGAIVGQDKRWADLRSPERRDRWRAALLHLVDLSAGVDNGTYSFELFVNNVFDELAEVTRTRSARF